MPVQRHEKPAPTRLPAGAFVTWMSQAHGKRTTHAGSVCGFVPAGASARALLPPNTTAAQLRSTLLVSQRDRYLVREAITRPDRPLQVLYYGPTAVTLERANPQYLSANPAQAIPQRNQLLQDMLAVMRTQAPEWAALTILDHLVVLCAQQAAAVSPPAAEHIRQHLGPLVPQLSSEA